VVNYALSKLQDTVSIDDTKVAAFIPVVEKVYRSVNPAFLLILYVQQVGSKDFFVKLVKLIFHSNRSFDVEMWHSNDRLALLQ